MENEVKGHNWDQVNTHSALVSILNNIESKDLETIKSSLYSLYMDVKLQYCVPNLPEGISSNHTNVEEYCEILQDLKSGKVASTVEKCASSN